MHWHYEIIQFDNYVGLHEFYYDDKGELKMVAQEPDWVGDNRLDLVVGLELALEDAKEKKINQFDDLPKAIKKSHQNRNRPETIETI